MWEDPTVRNLSTEELLERYAASRDAQTREVIITRHEPLVRSLARRFVRSGVPLEDLEQSAWVALIGALDRFDPQHHARFSTYAVHCIVGEIKRFFRDKTWAIRVPRHLQEISTRLGRTQESLRQRLGREPSLGEMAEALNVPEEDLAQVMELAYAYQPLRLDDLTAVRDERDAMCLMDLLGERDPALDRVENRVPLLDAMRILEPRVQRIITRRFLDGQSQLDVAGELGMSQMHVSRLERRALQRLRALLETHPGTPKRECWV